MSAELRSEAESRLRVSRRGFLKAGGVTAAVAAAGNLGAIPFASSAAAQQGWDEEHDVVIVGSGGAAFSAAITANELGSDVVMLEKGAYVGGTTLVSGAGLWVPNNRFLQEEGIEDVKEDAMKYMARYSFPHLYNPEDEKLGLSDHDYDMLSTFFDSANESVEFLEEAGAVTWAMQPQRPDSVDIGYNDYMDHFEENTVPNGRTIQPIDDEGNLGWGGLLIEFYQAYAEREGLPILLNHRVERVILNDAGEVVGVEATVSEGADSADEATAVAATPITDQAGTTKTFRARKGVIFGSGGYSRNEDMMRHLMFLPHHGGCGAPTNEGDFIRISSAVGAKLGNLNEAWRQESIFEQAIASSAAYNCIPYINGDSFIQVNKLGHRYVNEKRNYADRPKHHFHWDANNADWLNRLTFMVWDERTQQGWSGSFPYPQDPEGAPYLIKGDTLEDLAANMAERLESLKAHTGGVTVSDDFTENFLEEVQKFNEYARNGEDLDFQRGSFGYDVGVPYYSSTIDPFPSEDQPNPAMYPISDSGPYYAAIMSVGTFDTSGGPVINADAQILTWEDEPVSGLYGAGNAIASPSVAAYWGGGTTLGLAHAFGYRAGMHAHNSSEKTV